eukprot:5452327-Pleurochrysis_carterae.AAC.1
MVNITRSERAGETLGRALSDWKSGRLMAGFGRGSGVVTWPCVAAMAVMVVCARRVWQALARSDVPEEMSDLDLVPEVYSLLGMGRLVVTPAAAAAFAPAVRAFREHRARTVAAWGFIKNFVMQSDQPGSASESSSESTSESADTIPSGALSVSEQAAEVFSTVNASLAEYDLPLHMSDEGVLTELFGLLELPRDAVSFEAEATLLAAIRAHRHERAAAAANALRVHAARLRAVLRDDKSDSGGEAAAMEERGVSTGGAMSSALPLVEAANETLHALLGECLAWME